MTDDWKCGANPYAVEPEDCNWPHCGCDPHAQRVIEGLLEQGWIGPQEAHQRQMDGNRLDWLDEQNEQMNKRQGSNYGWGWSANHLRLALEDHHWPKRTVREAIDFERSKRSDKTDGASNAK